MNQLRKENAITLIALVITIILLLILSGVTLNIVLNGELIEKSQIAVDTYGEESARERLELELVNMKAEKINNKKYNQDNFLTTKLREAGFRVTGNLVMVDGWQFEINREKLEIIGYFEEIENKNFIIKYFANGEYVIELPENQTKMNGEEIKLSEKIPQRLGYEFKGWAINETEEPLYQPGDIYSNESDIILYAKWEEREEEILNSGNFSLKGNKNNRGTKTITWTCPDGINRVKYIATASCTNASYASYFDCYFENTGVWLWGEKNYVNTKSSPKTFSGYIEVVPGTTYNFRIEVWRTDSVTTTCNPCNLKLYWEPSMNV